MDDRTQEIADRIIARAIARSERHSNWIYRSADSVGALALGSLSLGIGLLALVTLASGWLGYIDPRLCRQIYMVWDYSSGARVPSPTQSSGPGGYRMVLPTVQMMLFAEAGLIIGTIGLGLEWYRRERISWLLVAGVAACTLTVGLFFLPAWGQWVLLW